MEEIIRTFIAIDLSEPIMRALKALMENLQSRLKTMPLRWVAPQNIHLTLKFLGETPANQLHRLIEGLNGIGPDHQAFSIDFTDIGCFPNLQRPRVIWVGGNAPTTLDRLARSVEQLSRLLGFPPENRPFSPHLTLARLSQQATNQDAAKIGELIKSLKIAPIGKLTVREFYVIKSDLRPQGPIYTKLAAIPLAGGETA